ncbi:MAG: ATP-binding protein [Gammaproteobacteria bacterium]|nr:ATP-binding protein [Gammaproteobacteria bacterium]
MSANLVDVTIHIDETLTLDQQNEIETMIREANGVVGVGHRKERAHLFIIEYDPDVINSSEILEVVKSSGVHAELIGL